MTAFFSNVSTIRSNKLAGRRTGEWSLVFSVSTVDLINILFIAAGVGICGLCLLQITASIHLRKEIRLYFQIFFLLLILYKKAPIDSTFALPMDTLSTA